MTWYVVDVEATGPCPGMYSMFELAIVKVSNQINQYLHLRMSPVDGTSYIESALEATGNKIEIIKQYESPEEQMKLLKGFLGVSKEGVTPVVWSDNIAFDWQFLNYYCHAFLGENPFGYSGRRIGDFYAGLTKDPRSSSKWKKFRKTKHTHNALDDAIGNAEALIEICNQFKIELPK